MAELSRNILAQPLCGQAMVRGTSSPPEGRFGLILSKFNQYHIKSFIIISHIKIVGETLSKVSFIFYLANSANCLGSDKSRPGIPPGGSFFPVMYSV